MQICFAGQTKAKRALTLEEVAPHQRRVRIMTWTPSTARWAETKGSEVNNLEVHRLVGTKAGATGNIVIPMRMSFASASLAAVPSMPLLQLSLLQRSERHSRVQLQGRVSPSQPRRGLRGRSLLFQAEFLHRTALQELTWVLEFER